jgi:hypothetical protein
MPFLMPYMQLKVLVWFVHYLTVASEQGSSDESQIPDLPALTFRIPSW